VTTSSSADARQGFTRKAFYLFIFILFILRRTGRREGRERMREDADVFIFVSAFMSVWGNIHFRMQKTDVCV